MDLNYFPKFYFGAFWTVRERLEFYGVVRSCAGLGNTFSDPLR
jgi:hypothetical protein